MVDERYDRAFQRGYEPVVEPAETRRRNPWMIVLWILAALLLAGGAYGLWQSEVTLNTPNVDNTVTFYVFPRILQAVAPWLFGVGLATLAGVVFVHAVQWRR